MDKALNKLQLVLNTAARILNRTQQCDVFYSSASLHWLLVQARADFNVLLIIYSTKFFLEDRVLKSVELEYDS